MVNGVDTAHALKVNDKYPLLVVTVVLVLLPTLAIFMFGNRKRQMALCFTSILSCISFISMMLFRVTNINAQTPGITGASYSIGAILPVLAMVFLFMAIMGIRKDDKLVKSMDRLR